jgi:hypothetical protein
MIIKLLPTQIEPYWEAIKFGAVKADQVPESLIQEYCNELLLDLLNSNLICLISINEKREIQRFLIVGFKKTFAGTKIMVFKTLYGYVHGEEEDWIEDSSKVYEWAKAEGCKFIQTSTANSQVMTLAERLGFKRISVNYELAL